MPPNKLHFGKTTYFINDSSCHSEPNARVSYWLTQLVRVNYHEVAAGGSTQQRFDFTTPCFSTSSEKWSRLDILYIKASHYS